jgi:hypothetical protein
LESIGLRKGPAVKPEGALQSTVVGERGKRSKPGKYNIVWVRFVPAFTTVKPELSQ